MVNELSSTLTIAKVDIQRKEYPLKKAYNLSFATLEKFVSIQLALTFSNGQRKSSEVVPLLGYNEESEELILRNLMQWKPLLIDKSVINAREIIVNEISKFPFSTSPVLTSIDLLDFEMTGVNLEEFSYVTPTSTQETPAFKELLSLSEEVIKVKLSGDAETDIQGLKICKEEILEYPFLLRLDANQAYDYEGASALFRYLSEADISNKIQYVEQPMEVGKEALMGELRKEFPKVEIMLDESIVTLDDLDLASMNDVSFVKLKLFKQGGILELIELAKQANQRDISVILGNGVATDISNRIENEIYMRYQDLFVAPLESNGFKKILN